MDTNIDWRVIAKSFNEDLLPDEQNELNEWLEASELHRAFYNEAMIGGHTNAEKGLDYQILKQKKEALFKRIDDRRIRRKEFVIRWGGYAALIVLVIGVTVLMKPGADKLEVEKGLSTLTQLPALPPGENKAILTLSDGRQVALDSVEQEVVADGAGKIQNKNNTLIYTENRSDVPVYNTISIPRGGEYHLILSDGTKIWVNSCTEIRYPVAFSSTERVVYLSGEAYFEVRKDSRPFKVMVNDLQVKVYGTSFNINAYDKRMVETTLIEGNVGLRRKGNDQEVHLKPSEQGLYQVDKASIEVQKVNVYDFIAWKNGEFVFNDETIEEIMKRLSVWYDIDVTYEDSSVKGRKFTGVMQRYSTIDKILYYIQETATIKFSANDNEIKVK